MHNIILVRLDSVTLQNQILAHLSSLYLESLTHIYSLLSLFLPNLQSKHFLENTEISMTN